MAGFENDIGFAKNFDFTQSDNQAPVEANGLATNGQLWIGTTAVNAGGTHVNVGSLSSPDSSITFSYSSPNITAVIAGGTTVGKTITGNTGGAISPTGGNWNIVTANSTPLFVGSGSTLTLDFNLTNLALGSAMPSITSATSNVGVGPGVLGTSTSASQNVGIGNLCLQTITSSVQNVCIGYASGRFISTGAGTNTFIGAGSGSTLNTGFSNTGLGSGALNRITTGSFCVGIGLDSGSNYTGSESSNITISNLGTLGESNTIRIGTQGSSPGQQNQAFMAGITGVTSVGSPVAISSTGKFSDLGFGSSTQVLTSNGAGVSPTWQAAAAGTVTNVTGTANQVAVATGTTTPVISLIGPYTPSTYTAHGVLIGEGTSSIVAAAVGATGTVLAGSTGADPSFSATPSVTSITLGGGSALGNYVTTTSWTPALTFGGTATGMTGTFTGFYMRIGSLVFFQASFTLTAKGSSTGTASVTLPISPASISEVPLKYSNITYVGNELVGQVNFAGGITFFNCATAAVAALLTETAFGNTSAMVIAGCYFV